MHGVVAVVASLGLSFSLSAAISCVTAASFRGSTDPAALRVLGAMAQQFNWVRLTRRREKWS